MISSRCKFNLMNLFGTKFYCLISPPTRHRSFLRSNLLFHGVRVELNEMGMVSFRLIDTSGFGLKEQYNLELPLRAHIVRTSNLKILCLSWTDYGKGMYLNVCRTCSTIIFPHSITYHWFNSFNISLICGVVFAIIFSWIPYCQDENGKDIKCMCSLRNDGRQLSEIRYLSKTQWGLSSCIMFVFIHETSFGLKKIVYREVRYSVLIFQPLISGL